MNIDIFKNEFQLQTNSNIPIYEQLAAFIRLQIKANTFTPGEKLIPETDLCDLLKVSRTTVRQAMDLLVNEGLLVRHRGKGSFIADAKMKRPLNYLYNFTENMQDLNAHPTSVTLVKEVIEAPIEVRTALQLPPNQTQVFHLERLRCANNEPILIERTYIPYYLCNGIEQYDFSITSLYHILGQTYHLNLYHATETIEAVLIRKNEADLLSCNAKDAGYKICRISHLDSGYSFEYTTSITKADKCIFQMELYKNTNNHKLPVNIKRNITLDSEE